MVGANEIISPLPVDGKLTVLVDDQNLDDIRSNLLHYHKKHRNQYNKIAKNFWCGSAEKTAKCLFDFCKKNVTYKIEPERDQSIKSPGRILRDSYGDCKHYASFINGVADALHKEGYPIEGTYIFVSDDPTQPIHHVFAGINGKWVDPVLKNFNERPIFYNMEQMTVSPGNVGRLTYLSGTSAIGSAEVGKKRQHRNIFKEIKEGVKRTERGLVRDVQAVKHLALKVAGAPARNAFLALLDVNAFDMAKHLNDTLATNQRGELLHVWKNIGGKENKLISAIHNGYAMYKRHHHISGIGAISPTRRTHHSRWITDNIDEWRHMIEHGSHVFPYTNNQPPTAKFNSQARTFIGQEPTSTAGLMALASGIIALIQKFLKNQDPHTQQAAAMAAHQGTIDIMKKAAKGFDVANNEGGHTPSDYNAMQASADHGNMSVSSGYDAQGQPELTVHDVQHPALQNAGNPNGGAAADVLAPGSSPAASPVQNSDFENNNTNDANSAVAVPAGSAKDKVANFVTKIEDTAKKYAKPVLYTVGVVVLVTKVIIPAYEGYTGKKLYKRR